MNKEVATFSNRINMLNRVSSVALAAVAFAFVAGQQAGAQSGPSPTSLIVDGREPLPMAVSVTKIFTLSDSEFPLFAIDIIGARLANGDFVFVGADRSQLGVFSSRGRFIRAVGRVGSGPGEFRGINKVLIGQGDSVHVFDILLRRRTVFDPNLTEIGRTATAPRIAGSAALSSDGLVVAGQYGDASSVGFPLHLVNEDGSIARSFGIAPREFNQELALTRNVWGSPKHSTVVTSPTDTLAFDVWQHAKTFAAFRRNVDWFKPQNAPLWINRGRELRPRPFVVGTAMHSPTNVWAAIATPAKAWRSSKVEDTRRESGLRPPTVEQYSSAFDTVLELYDLRSLRVIGRTRIAGLCAFLSGTTNLWQARETPEGDLAISIYDLRSIRR